MQEQYSRQDYQSWRKRQRKLNEHYKALSKFKKQELIVWILVFVVLTLAYIILQFLAPPYAILSFAALLLVGGMLISRIWHVTRFKMPEELKEESQESDLMTEFQEPILPINEDRLRKERNDL